MKKIIYIFIPVVIIAIAAFIFFTKIKKVVVEIIPTSTQTPSVVETSSPTAEVANVKTFTVDGSNFKFAPNTITVNKGDNVKITFKDDDGMHNLVVDGYNVTTETIKTGTESSVAFVADKSGTFEYYCSVGTHRAKGMTGTLTVK